MRYSNTCISTFMYLSLPSSIRALVLNSIALNQGSASNTTESLPSTGAGGLYASICNAAKQTWIADRGVSFVSTSTFTTESAVLAYNYATHTTTLEFFSNPTPYTLCDGYPRRMGYTSTVESLMSTATQLVQTITSAIPIFDILAEPDCTIQSRDCAKLNASYLESWTAYQSLRSATKTAHRTNNLDPAYSAPIEPICGKAIIPQLRDLIRAPKCRERFKSAKLLYWPVMTRSDSLCDESISGTTMGPSIEGLANTFVTWNTTLTSPTVYMAFEGTWVYTSSGTVASSMRRMLLPQSATAVSTYCGKAGNPYASVQPVNYADLNYPVPAKAYRCQPRCHPDWDDESSLALTSSLEGDTASAPPLIEVTRASTGLGKKRTPHNLCSTIWDDFAPVFSIPDAFEKLRESAQETGGFCSFVLDRSALSFGPPEALTRASDVIRSGEPTPAWVGWQPPDPGNTPAPCTALQTSSRSIPLPPDVTRR